MRVRVDTDSCVCSGTCVALVPEVFAVDDFELRIVEPEPPEALRARLTEAVDMCPTASIRLE